MRYIDAHFHLDLWKNPEELVNEIESHGVYTIAVTNSPSVFDFTQKLATKKKYIRAAIGLHPELVEQRASELPLLLNKIHLTRYVGEIGLDYSRNAIKSKLTQKEVFMKIIDKCAQDSNKIITLHSRRAEEDVINIIGDNYPGITILHWYSGSLKYLKQALNFGFYFSINHQMTVSQAGRRIIEHIPLERLLTESDGPFISVNNIPNSPLTISSTCEKIGEIKNLSGLEIRDTVYENFSSIIRDIPSSKIPTLPK